MMAPPTAYQGQELSCHGGAHLGLNRHLPIAGRPGLIHVDRGFGNTSQTPSSVVNGTGN